MQMTLDPVQYLTYLRLSLEIPSVGDLSPVEDFSVSRVLKRGPKVRALFGLLHAFRVCSS